MTVVLLMGVAGSGKSTLGAAVAELLGWPFQEGDAFHPEANVAKMAAGRPLTDADREPWLARVRLWIATHEEGVITCSALKRRYRDQIGDGHVVFVHLTADRDELLARLRGRQGHFLPAELLDSQLEDLEAPDPDERVLTLDATDPLESLCRRVVETVGH